MSQEKFDNEIDIRRFLLGDMNADERAAFEARFIAEGGELFERIGVCEDELIESYIRGTLAAGEKTKFEQNFLTTDARRRRVAFTREMLDELSAGRAATAKKTEAVAENPPVRKLLVNLFRKPEFAVGVAFAILLPVFGFWFLVLRKPEKSDEIVRQITPTPPVLQASPNSAVVNRNAAVEANINSANNPETNKVPANVDAENPNKNQPPNAVPKPVVATLALLPGAVRGEGEISELNLTKATKGANFQLQLESLDYRTYRAEIVDADGNVIYRSAELNPRAARINAFFPTAKLKKGDYFVKLYGFNAAGAEESAADFQFRVNRK